MLRNQSAAYSGMLFLTIAFTVLAVVTLIPNPAASKPSVLGYRAVCSFSPASTALCALAAAACCTLRGRLVSRNARSARYRPLILPMGVGIILVAVTIVFGALFLSAQARFQAVIRSSAAGTASGGAPAASAAGWQDGERSATVSEGEVSATVRLTVAGGKIESIELADGRNVEPRVAVRLFDEVKAAQSTEVDAVSGATASSAVVLSAISEALRRAP